MLVLLPLLVKCVALWCIDTYRQVLVRDPTQSGDVLIQNGAVRQNDGRNVAFRVDRVEVSARIGFVSFQVHLFGVDIQFRFHSGDERRST